MRSLASTSLALLSLLALVIAASGCGGGGGSSKPSAEKSSHKVRLTENDIPDVLMPGIWPSGITAYRDGDVVNVYTGWYPKAENKDDAQTICAQVMNDLGTRNLAVTVYAAGNDPLAYSAGEGDTCHRT